MDRENRVGKKRVARHEHRPCPGIIIHGREDKQVGEPRIHAFVWGGEMRPRPTLPYGRRKGAA